MLLQNQSCSICRLIGHAVQFEVYRANELVHSPSNNHTDRIFGTHTISDVILHMRYTAREGGSEFKRQASTDLQTAINEFVRTNEKGLTQGFSLRHDFPTEWSRFLTTSDDDGNHVQSFTFTKGQFPFLFQGKEITINKANVLGVPKADKNASNLPEVTANEKIELQNGLPIGLFVHKVTKDWSQSLKKDSNKFDWTLNGENESCGSLEDILIIFNYTVGGSGWFVLFHQPCQCIRRRT